MDCKSKNSRILVNCGECGESFSKYKRRVNRSEKDFCSPDCKNKHWSENIAPTLESAGDSVSVSCDNCDGVFEKPQSHNNYEHTFCDKACHGEWISENRVGNAHPNWVEGSEKIYYGTNWHKHRRKVLRRDNECQKCGMSIEEHIEKFGQKPDVHHIKPIKTFDDKQKANKMDNLKTLCRPCHAEVESSSNE